MVLMLALCLADESLLLRQELGVMKISPNLVRFSKSSAVNWLSFSPASSCLVHVMSALVALPVFLANTSVGFCKSVATWRP